MSRKLTELLKCQQASQGIYLHKLLGTLDDFIEYLFVVDEKPARIIWFLPEGNFDLRKMLVGQDDWEKLHENKKDRAVRTIERFLRGGK